MEIATMINSLLPGEAILSYLNIEVVKAIQFRETQGCHQCEVWAQTLLLQCHLPENSLCISVVVSKAFGKYPATLGSFSPVMPPLLSVFCPLLFQILGG